MWCRGGWIRGHQKWCGIQSGMRLYRYCSDVPHAVSGRLTGVHNLDRNFECLAHQNIFWRSRDVSSYLRVADLAVNGDRFSRLPKGSPKQDKTADSNRKSGRGDDEHPHGPKGHVLLGLQVFLGGILILIGFIFISKASSEQTPQEQMGPRSYLLCRQRLLGARYRRVVDNHDRHLCSIRTGARLLVQT